MKTEIGRLAKRDKSSRSSADQHRGHAMYRADVGEGKYLRYIRVSEEGQLEGVRGDIDPGEVVQFNSLPGQAKQKIGALAKAARSTK